MTVEAKSPFGWLIGRGNQVYLKNFFLDSDAFEVYKDFFSNKFLGKILSQDVDHFLPLRDVNQILELLNFSLNKRMFTFIPDTDGLRTGTALCDFNVFCDLSYVDQNGIKSILSVNSNLDARFFADRNNQFYDIDTGVILPSIDNSEILDVVLNQIDIFAERVATQVAALAEAGCVLLSIAENVSQSEKTFMIEKAFDWRVNIKNKGFDGTLVKNSDTIEALVKHLKKDQRQRIYEGRNSGSF